MDLPLPLLYLYDISLCIRTTTHGPATATAASELHPLSSCCIVLPIAPPLLTAALQLSYWEASNWSPNSDIFVRQETLLMLKLPLSLTSAPSLTSVLLQQLPASHDVSHLTMPSYPGATVTCFLHCFLTLSWESCTVAPSVSLAASLSTNIR